MTIQIIKTFPKECRQNILLMSPSMTMMCYVYMVNIVIM